MAITDEIADIFLTAYAHRADARRRAETLTERLKDSPDWTQEEIDELRRRIEQDLERERL
jgi:ElaB/YqjD/DUF883 family membrane-anchored ribosome-binding protein